MAGLSHLDSHILVWLYLPRLDLLSPRAKQALEEGDLAVSPMAVLEVTYLREIGRLATDGPTVLGSLHDQFGLVMDETPFPRVIDEAHTQSWTRDPFDRLIAAQALAAGATLVSADEAMRKHVPHSVW